MQKLPSRVKQNKTKKARQMLVSLLSLVGDAFENLHNITHDNVQVMS